MKCPSCGHENIPGADQCEKCDHDLMLIDVDETFTATAPTVAQSPLSDVEAAATVMVGPNATVAEVVDQMNSSNLSCVLVVSGKKLEGIFSDRDLLLRVADRFDENKSRPINQFMTPNPETLGPDDTIAWALNKMDVGGYRHIPVVDDGVPTRVVSVKDILRHMATEYCNVA